MIQHELPRRNKEESYTKDMNGLQKREVRYGLEKGLDVSLYARPEFNHQQMEQIRYGLENGLDVFAYAKPEFNYQQMEQIRYGLENGIDVSVYLNPDFGYLEMKKIRKDMQQGLDVYAYARPEYDTLQMEEIQKGMNQGVDIEIYAKPEYEFMQMRQIREGLQQKLDVSTYATPEFNFLQMEQIREGLEQGLDVSVYATPEFNFLQMEQIREGQNQGLDVSVYAVPKFDPLQMRQIREGLQQKLDVSTYATPEFNFLQMEQIREGLEQGLDVSVYATPEFNFLQMEQIREGQNQGLDVSVYAVPKFDPLQMEQIREGLQQRLDVSVYATPEFNYQQMEQIREGLEQKLDVSVYAVPEYEFMQMRQIREGLQQRLDVSTYATPEYDYRKMKEIKEQLSQKKDAVMEFKETHDIPLLSWQDAAKVRLAVKGREVVGPLNPLHIQTAELIKEYQIAGMEMKDIVSNKVDDIGTKLGMEDTQFVKNLVCSIAATSRETYEEYMNCVLKNQPDELVAVSPRLAARLQKEEINIVSIGNNGELHHYSNIGQILEGSGKDFYTAKEPFERMLNEQDMPVIQCEWSESYDFDDGKYYTVSEFDKIMKGADTVRVRQKQELIEKYGSSEELLMNGSMEEIAEGCGYAKVKFVVRTGTDRKEDRQDIGNADGGVLDHIRIWDKSHRFTSKLEKGMEQEQQFDQYCQTIMRKREVDLEMNPERAENLFDKTPSSDMTKEIFSHKTRIRTNAQMLMKGRMRGIEL